MPFHDLFHDCCTGSSSMLMRGDDPTVLFQKIQDRLALVSSGSPGWKKPRNSTGTLSGCNY
jgi:hypothetical protein